jgi:hypothetical protein
VEETPEYGAPWIINDDATPTPAQHTVAVGDYVHWDPGKGTAGEWIWEGPIPRYPTTYKATEFDYFYDRLQIRPLSTLDFPPTYGLPGNPVYQQTPSGSTGPFNLVPGFIRLTGPDGDPGKGDLPVWGAPVTGPASGPFVPDLTNVLRVSPDGVDIRPAVGDLLFTNADGDIKLWQVGPGNTTTPLDLPNGPTGATGSSASRSTHTHKLRPLGTLSYGEVRDRFPTLKYEVDPDGSLTP